ncbi:MAG TPA: hypothetical protein VF753_09105 [Terriglobales bacterium]
MPESGGSNVEIAHHLSHSHGLSQSFAHQALEIVEAIVLAVVAVSTAWSGYQAALWTGHQAELYGEASKLRILAEASGMTANQERLYNAATVGDWLRAEASGDKKLAALFERRVLPEFRPAFEAWKQTDPVNNPQAPAGPMLMPQYRSSKAEEAAKLNDQASSTFEQGNVARRHSDEYVRCTVTLATVLLLTAISQRFKMHGVRVGLAAVAAVLLCFLTVRILTLPRAVISMGGAQGDNKAESITRF